MALRFKREGDNPPKVAGLKPEAVVILAVASGFPGTVTVTGGTEDAPGRLPHSLHKTGYAVDLRWIDGLARYLRDMLTDEYDVVEYRGSHVHVEFDPT